MKEGKSSGHFFCFDFICVVLLACVPDVEDLRSRDGDCIAEDIEVIEELISDPVGIEVSVSNRKLLCVG